MSIANSSDRRVIKDNITKSNLKGGVDIVQEISLNDDENQIFMHDKSLRRGLKQRHIQMIALVGVFGTGLFLSSGGTLYLVGNVGMLIAYVFVGIVVGLNQLANAEISTLMPVTGAHIRHAEHFVDKAFGFALGWLSVYSSLIPAELSATAVVVSYWTDANPAIFITIFGLIIIVLNSYTIRFYGEVEFFFGCLKVLLIVGLFFVCIIIDLGGVPGQEKLGFHYWKESPFKPYFASGSLGKFIAFWKCVSGVVYSYGGVQGISFYAGETEYPRRAIYTAAKRIFYRVFILYFFTIFALTMVVSANDPAIGSPTGTAEGSPFVIAMERAGIKVLQHIVNAVVLTSAFSAANLSLISGSRTLFALASKNQAPKIFLKTNARGLPYVGIITIAVFLPLAYMSVSTTSAIAFSYFQSLTSANLLLTWCAISTNYLFMRRAMKIQGYSRERLPYSFKFTPYAAGISLFFSLLFLITGGFTNFLSGNFSISSFISSYFIIPLFFILFFSWKFFKKTKILRPEEVDLESLFQDIIDNSEPPLENLRGWQLLKFLWS